MVPVGEVGAFVREQRGPLVLGQTFEHAGGDDHPPGRARRAGQRVGVRGRVGQQGDVGGGGQGAAERTPGAGADPQVPDEGAADREQDDGEDDQRRRADGLVVRQGVPDLGVGPAVGQRVAGELRGADDADQAEADRAAQRHHDAEPGEQPGGAARVEVLLGEAGDGQRRQRQDEREEDEVTHGEEVSLRGRGPGRRHCRAGCAAVPRRAGAGR